jgi:hypothetical protein
MEVLEDAMIHAGAPHCPGCGSVYLAGRDEGRLFDAVLKLVAEIKLAGFLS